MFRDVRNQLMGAQQAACVQQAHRTEHTKCPCLSSLKVSSSQHELHKRVSSYEALRTEKAAPPVQSGKSGLSDQAQMRLAAVETELNSFKQDILCSRTDGTMNQTGGQASRQ